MRELDVRIVAATNRDLAALVEAGKFRRDLYYRINVIEIKLPALRERKEDIRPLVDYFIERFRTRDDKDLRGVTREAFDNLSKRLFPGNVRELENIIERAVVLCRGNLIRIADLPLEAGTDASGVAGSSETAGSRYDMAMREFESGLIARALEKTKGNKSAAARDLGISERHLRSCLKRLDSI